MLIGRSYKSLDFINKWKAKEMKTLNLLMIPLFYDRISKGLLKVLNLFRRIVLYMSNSSFTQAELTVLGKYEEDFVKAFSNVFSNYGITQKVHRMLHYHQSIKFVGNSVNFSCFPFEGFLSFLSHGTHSTKSNLNELYFLSNLNTNMETYKSKYIQSNDPLFYKIHGNVIVFEGVRYELKNKYKESDGGKVSHYQVLYNVDEDIKYDARIGQSRLNSRICFADVNGELQYGNVEDVLYDCDVIVLVIKVFDVNVYKELHIDDLIEYEDDFFFENIYPSQIKGKYITTPFRDKESFIVCSHNKQIY